MTGPYGFVSWDKAEKVELVDQNGAGMLVVGAYEGWTLWIKVPPAQRDAVEGFVSQKTGSRDATMERAETL